MEFRVVLASYCSFQISTAEMLLCYGQLSLFLGTEQQ